MGMVENIKDALKLLQASDNAELLKSYIVIEKEFNIMNEELKKLREENEYLKSMFEVHENMYIKDNAYYYLTDGIEKGPYCTKCYDDENKLILMQENDNGMSRVTLQCPKCKNSYLKKRYTQQETQRVVASMYDVNKL